MSKDLTFRLFREDDLEGVLRLWNENSGWGELTAQDFHDWYVDTPHGKCLIVVAADRQNRIVGQEVFTPAKVFVDGQEKKALRISAPILSAKLRMRISDESHPVPGMYKLGAETALERGFNLIYSFPAIAWLPIVKLVFPKIGIDMNKVVTAPVECYSISPERLSGKANNFKVGRVTSFGDDYDALWQAASREFPLHTAIVRSSNWLRWKLGGHFVLEVCREDELLGYVAVKKETGMIVDALAKTANDLKIVVKEAVRSLSNLKDEFPTREIKLLKTESTLPIIEELGFEKIDYKLGFWCYSPDDSISFESLQPSRWYMMPND